MNAGPPEPSPEETPELPAPPADDTPSETPSAETPSAETPAAEMASAEMPAAEEPAPPAPEPETEAPMAEAPMAEAPVAEAPAAYTPPPAPMPPPPRRGRGSLVAIVLVVILVIVAVVAYAGVGYAYGQSRIDGASTSYNAAIDHANKYNDTINSLTSKIVAIDTNTTSTQLQSNKTLVTQLTFSSQQAQTQIVSDDASLSQAQSDLNANSWLTALRKSDIDRYTTKIGHLRDALATAKTITADYVQFGTFYQSFYDVLLDLDNLASQTEPTGALAAITKIKTDTTKAIGLDTAPGVAPEVGGFLTDVLKSANDLTALYGAVASGDATAEANARAAVDQDITKLDNDDLSGAPAKTDAFYKPLIDAYNKEIDAANKT